MLGIISYSTVFDQGFYWKIGEYLERNVDHVSSEDSPSYVLGVCEGGGGGVMVAAGHYG